MMALHTLHNNSIDSIILMSVGILSILVGKLTRFQIAKIGANKMFMSELLSIVVKRMSVTNADITLQFTLSALWNLTDESPGTCKVFLSQNGREIFFKLLKTFPDNHGNQNKGAR